MLHITIYWYHKIYGKLTIKFANNLSQGIHKIKCKYWHDDKKFETCILNINIATAFVNAQILKMI